MPGADHFAFGGFDRRPRGRPRPECACGSVISANVAAALARPPLPARAPAPPMPPRDICALAGLASSAAMWWPKPRTPQVDLAQSVEEQQPGLDGRMLELLLRRIRAATARSPRAAAGRRCCVRAARGAPRGGSGGERPSGARMSLHDRHELVVPAPQRVGVAAAEVRRTTRSCAAISVHHSSARRRWSAARR